MAKIDLTENKAKQSPQGGVLVGKKDGQTIIYDDGKVGGWFVGKTHKEGGIQGIDKTSGQPIEVQTGEVIITAPALADQTPREFQGKMMTNRQILSKINHDAGGVAFAEDGMEVSNKAIYKGSKYSYGGKMMSDKDIVDEINKCGCDHDGKFDEGGELNNYKYSKKFGEITIYTNLEQEYVGNNYSPFESKGSFKASIRKSDLENIALESKYLENFNFKYGVDDWNTISKKLKQEKITKLELFSVGKHVKTFEFKPIFNNGGDIKSIYENENDYVKYLVERNLTDGVELYKLHKYLKSKNLDVVGLIPDNIKKDPEYIKIKRDYKLAFERLRQMPIYKYPKNRDRVQESKDRKIANEISDKIIQIKLKNEKFNKGGEMKKENLVKDAKSGNTPARDLNNYNDMLDVEADGQVGGDTGIYEDGGGVGNLESDPKRKNIQKNILSLLGEITNSVWYFTDKNFSDNPSIENADYIRSGFDNDGEYLNYEVKIPEKKFLDVDYVMQQINKKNIYTSFANKFSELLKKEGISYNAYATTYGIGIFIFANRFAKENSNKIEELLDKTKIEYKKEYSDAHVVLRYKISKSKENIEKIDKFVKNGLQEQSKENYHEMEANTNLENKESAKVLTPKVSNWNDVPSNWKDTKKVKKVIWANNPYDKGLYSIVTPFLGHDELRPIFEGINFDKNGITCTDTHKLITLPYPNKEYEGIYNADLSKKKDNEQIKIDGKYANYESIIPESKNTIKYEVDVYKLLQYTNVALKYASKYTFAVNYKIYDEVMAFNGKFLIEELNTLLKLGHEKVYAHFVGYTKAFLFSSSKNYELGNDELLLIMPVMVSGEKYLGAKDLDYNRELSVYYDFNDNEIHNADGSIAEFKMNYESNSAINSEDVKPFENMIKKSKNRIPILDNVSVQNGIARSSNLDSEFELNGVNLPDGIYSAKNGILEITMEAIEDFPTKPIFQVDEYTIEFSIPSPVLEYYIDKLKLVVGKDELRPVMMGICLHHTSDNKLFLASTDANILLKIDITQYVEMPMYNKDLKTIIQPNYLYDYLNAVEETTLFIKSNRVGTKIDSDKWNFYCRNIDGNFPNVDAVIPRESNKLISVDLSELRNCLNSDFAKKYESESNNKDGIFIFNHEHEVFIGTFDRYARENKKEKIEKLCNANISVKDDYYYYNDQSILLIMPVMTDDENVNFSFGKKILQRVISIVSDKKLEMHYSALNRAYLTPIHSFDYKKTTKEHKVKEQPAKLKEVKAKKENSEKAELLEAIETLSMLGDLEQDEQERKEIFEALEILNMIKKSSNYENGGMMKRNLSFTPIQTPLN